MRFLKKVIAARHINENFPLLLPPILFMAPISPVSPFTLACTTCEPKKSGARKRSLNQKRKADFSIQITPGERGKEGGFAARTVCLPETKNRKKEIGIPNLPQVAQRKDAEETKNGSGGKNKGAAKTLAFVGTSSKHSGAKKAS